MLKKLSFPNIFKQSCKIEKIEKNPGNHNMMEWKWMLWFHGFFLPRMSLQFRDIWHVDYRCQIIFDTGCRCFIWLKTIDSRITYFSTNYVKSTCIRIYRIQKAITAFFRHSWYQKSVKSQRFWIFKKWGCDFPKFFLDIFNRLDDQWKNPWNHHVMILNVSRFL